MGIQVVNICTGLATNSVAGSTGVDLQASGQTEAGPVFPNVGAGNAVLLLNISPGTTPGAYDIQIEESNDDVTYTTVSNSAIDEATVGSLVFRNVTIAKRYIRAYIVEATANAGTLDAFLLSA